MANNNQNQDAAKAAQEAAAAKAAQARKDAEAQATAELAEKEVAELHAQDEKDAAKAAQSRKMADEAVYGVQGQYSTNFLSFELKIKIFFLIWTQLEK